MLLLTVQSPPEQHDEMLKLMVCNLVAVVHKRQSCKYKLQRHKIINVVSCSSEKLKTINLWPQKCEYFVLIIFVTFSQTQLADF